MERRNLTSNRCPAVALAAILTLAITSTPAPAADFTWDRSRPSNDWDDVGPAASLFDTNWTTPLMFPGAADTVTFPASASDHTVHLNGNRTIISATFTGASGYLIHDSSTQYQLTLSSGDITASGATTHRFGTRADIAIGANATWDIAGSTTLEIDSNITGNFTLTKTGSGILDLDANNSHTATIVEGGTLDISGANRLGTSGADLTLANDSTLRASASLSIPSNRSLILDSGGTINTNGNDVTWNGPITGTGPLTKTGSGDFIPTGTNTYTGGTELNEGTLVIDADANLGNAAGTLTFDGGTLSVTAFHESTRPFVFNDATSTIHTDAIYGASGNISGSGGLEKTGAGDLVLGGTNTYTGNTLVTAGNLVIFNSDEHIPNGSPVRIQPGAKLALNNATETIEGLQNSAGTVELANGSTLQLMPTSTRTFTGSITGDANTTFAIIGGNVQALTGANPNFSGTARIDGGTLRLNSANNLQNATVQINADNGLDITTSNINFNIGALTGTGDLDIDDQTLTVGANNTSPAAYSGALSGSGNLTKVGTGTLTLSGASPNFVGTAKINAGKILLGHVDALQKATAQINGNNRLDINNLNANLGGIEGSGNLNIGAQTLTVGAANDDTTYTGALTGSTDSELVHNGTGKLTLSTATSAFDDLEVDNGTVEVSSGADVDLAFLGLASLANPGNVTVSGMGTTLSANSAVLGVTLDDGTGNGPGGTLTVNNDAAVSIAGATQFETSASALIIDAATFQTGSLSTFGGATGTIDISDPTSADPALTIGADDSDTTFIGLIQDASSGPGSLFKTGTGALTLNAANTHSGTTTIDGGTVVVQNADALQNSTVEININDGLDITTHNINANLGGLAGTGNLDIGTRTLSVGNNDSDTTYAGQLSGSGGSLTKTGTGTLTLSGNNSYDGGTDIESGTLRLGTSTALGTGDIVPQAGGASKTLRYDNGISVANNIFLLSDLSISVTGSDAATHSGIIDDSAGFTLIKTGTGTLTLSGNNSYKDGTDVNEGTLALAHNNAAGTNSINLNGTTLAYADTVNIGNFLLFDGNVTLHVDTGSATQSGEIEDILTFQSITKTGAGTLTLAAANNYFGDTNINGGAIAVSSDANLGGATGPVSFDGGTLRFDAQFDLANARQIFVNAGGGTFDTNTFDTTVSQAISGDGGLTKEGTGTLTLAGNNGYSGGTNINGGTLAVSSDSNLGVAANPIQFDGGTLRLNASFDMVDMRTAVINNGGGTIDTNGFNTTIKNTISGSGDLTKNGAGTLTVTGNNTHTGDTFINAGTLQLGNGGTTGIVSVTGNVTNNGTLIYNRSNDLVWDPEIDGSGNLIKEGAGTLTLTDNSNYTGGTTINAGTLRIGEGASPGSIEGDVVNHGTFAIARSGTYTFDGIISGSGNLVVEGPGTFNPTGNNTYEGDTIIDGGTLLLNDNTANAIPDVSPVAVDTSATFHLDGVTERTGGLLVSNGAVILDNGATLELHLAAQRAFGGTFTGAADTSLVVSGVIRQILSGASPDFFGTTTINSSQIKLNDPNVLQNSTVNIQVDNGLDVTSSNLDVNLGGLEGTGNLFLGNQSLTVGANNEDTVYEGQLSGSAGSLIKNGTGSLTLSSDNDHSGDTTINAGKIVLQNPDALQDTTVHVIADNSLDITTHGVDANLGALAGLGDIDLGSQTLTVGSNDASEEYNGNLSGTGGSFTKVGSGINFLSGVNTHTGTTTISQGQIRILETNGLQNSTVDIQVNNGLDITSSNVDANIGGLAGTGNFNLGVQFLTVGSNNEDTVYEGVISDSDGTLIKTGTGTLTLTGASTYSAMTFINGGTLLANNTSGSATGVTAVDVNDTATLGGTGSVAGPVTVRSGGTLAPGESAGQFTINNDLSFLNNATLAIEIDDPTTGSTTDPEPGIDHDQAVVTGNVSLNGTLDVQLLNNYDPAYGDTFTAMTWNGTRTGTFDNFQGVVINPDGTKSLAVEIDDTLKEMRITSAIPGDANLNGEVTIGDLSILASFFGDTPGLGSWRKGDFNHDGQITIGDLSLLASNFGETNATIGSSLVGPGISLEAAASLAGIDLSTVPEPSALITLGLSGFFMTQRRYRGEGVFN